MKLKHDKLLSNVAFNCNLRHYNGAWTPEAAQRALSAVIASARGGVVNPGEEEEEEEEEEHEEEEGEGGEVGREDEEVAKGVSYAQRDEVWRVQIYVPRTTTGGFLNGITGGAVQLDLALIPD